MLFGTSVGSDKPVGQIFDIGWLKARAVCRGRLSEILDKRATNFDPASIGVELGPKLRNTSQPWVSGTKLNVIPQTPVGACSQSPRPLRNYSKTGSQSPVRA